MLGLLLASGFASAQTPPADSPPAASNAAPQMNRLDRMAILLDLTPGQKQALQAALQQGRQEMRSYWESQKASGAKPNFQQMRQERQQLQQQVVTTMESQGLSETQIQKLEILMTPQSRHGWRHGPRAAGSGSSSSSAGQ
jgi:hypothetical protein